MKSAKEMFGELGWKMFNDSFDSIAYRPDRTQSIYFYKEDKCFRMYDGFDQFEIDAPLMKSVIKQCEELGWLDE